MAVDRLQLLPGEEVLVDIKPHWSFLSGPLAVSVIVIAVGVGLDIGIPHTSVTGHWIEGAVVAVPSLWLAVRVVRWRTTRLVVTSARLIELRGMTSGRQAETPLAHILSVIVVQSLARRVIGTGRLELEIRGEDQVRWIDDVRKPMVLRRVINRRLPPFLPDPDGGPGL